MKKLSRIHYNPNRKSGKVEIEIVDERSDSLVDVTTLKSNDLPRPELDRALQDMRPHLMDLCELPDEWEDDVTILGVSAIVSSFFFDSIPIAFRIFDFPDSLMPTRPMQLSVISSSASNKLL